MTDQINVYLREIGRTPLLTEAEEAAAFTELEEAKRVLFQKALLLKPIRARMLVDLKSIALGKSRNTNSCRQKTDDDKNNIRASRNMVMTLLKKIRRTRKTSRLWDIIQHSGVYFSLYQLEQWIGLADKNPILGELSKCLAIKNDITKANLRLVVSIAKCYQRRPSMGFPDLIQEGNIGLMKAVGKFNYKLGNRLSTYAHWWIRQSITRAMIDKGFIIRIPVHHVANIRTFYRAWGILVQKNIRKPTNEELAEKLQWPIEDVVKALATVRDSESLNSPVGDDGTELGDLLPDVTTHTPEEEVADKRLGERVRYFLPRLSAQEKSVLEMCFGMGVSYDDDKNLAEIGRQRGLTRERIRQIKERGLKKLKRMMRREGGRNGRKFFENIKT